MLLKMTLTMLQLHILNMKRLLVMKMLKQN